MPKEHGRMELGGSGEGWADRGQFRRTEKERACRCPSREADLMENAEKHFIVFSGCICDLPLEGLCSS